jgi:hypothetical protein
LIITPAVNPALTNRADPAEHPLCSGQYVPPLGQRRGNWAESGGAISKRWQSIRYAIRTTTSSKPEASRHTNSRTEQERTHASTLTPMPMHETYQIGCPLADSRECVQIISDFRVPISIFGKCYRIATFLVGASFPLMYGGVCVWSTAAILCQPHTVPSAALSYRYFPLQSSVNFAPRGCSVADKRARKRSGMGCTQFDSPLRGEGEGINSLPSFHTRSLGVERVSAAFLPALGTGNKSIPSTLCAPTFASFPVFRERASK